MISFIYNKFGQTSSCLVRLFCTHTKRYEEIIEYPCKLKLNMAMHKKILQLYVVTASKT